MAIFNIRKVITLPLEFEPNTLYAIPDGVTGLKLYMSSDDGATVRSVPTSDELMSSMIVFSITAPAVEVPQLFWWDVSTGTLFVKYDDGDRVQWVEGSPSIPFPSFAGNGVAESMARSDHWHNTITVDEPQW